MISPREPPSSLSAVAEQPGSSGSSGFDAERRQSKIFARRNTVSGRRGSAFHAAGDDFHGDDKPRGEPEAAADEAYQAALRDCHASFDELVASAAERVADVQEGAAEQLTEGARVEFEGAVRDVFDGLLRNAKQLTKELSEADSKAARQHAKGAAKLFQVKLEHARTAANVSLKNKSVEMSATFHKKLLEQVNELKEGGGALLSDAQTRCKELLKELDEEKRKGDSQREAYKLSQKLLSTAETKLARAEEEREKLKAERDAVRKGLDEAYADMRRAMQEGGSHGGAGGGGAGGGSAGGGSGGSDSGYSASVTAALESAFRELGQSIRDGSPSAHRPSGEKRGLADQVHDLVRLYKQMQLELQTRTSELQTARDVSHASLAEATAEAERASMMHAEECKRLTQALASRMRSEQDERASQRGVVDKDEWGNAQLRRLLVEMTALQSTCAEMEGELHTSGSLMKEELRKLGVRLRDALQAGAAAKQEAADLRVLLEAERNKPKPVAVVSPGGTAKPSSAELRAMDELRATNERLTSEMANAKLTLQTAFDDLGLTRQANKSLAQQLKELADSAEACKKREGTLRGELDAARRSAADQREEAREREAAMEAELARARELAGQKDWWQREATRLRAEMERAQEKLRNALSNIAGLQHDKRSLADQVADFVHRFRTAEAALQHTSAELLHVTDALTRTTKEMSKLAEAARSERAALVRATVASLHQLRAHLTFTLAGLRVSQPRGDEASAAWKHAAGVLNAAGGDPLVLGFMPPRVRALDPSHRTAADAAAAAFDDQVPDLPAVQITPSLPLEPPETWHSDTPANPLWPTKRLGKPSETHRWGANPRPPTHVNPGRVRSARAARTAVTTYGGGGSGRPQSARAATDGPVAILVPPPSYVQAPARAPTRPQSSPGVATGAATTGARPMSARA